MNRKHRLVAFALASFLTFLITARPLLPQSASKPAPPKSLADLRPIEQDDRILKAPPTIEVQPDGVVHLSFETMVATPGVRVFFGQINPDTSPERPLFEFEIRETLRDVQTFHRVSFDLKRIETAEARAGDSPERDDEVYYRLEIFDPRISGAKYFQARFYYFSQAARYEKRTGILYGPFIDQVSQDSAVLFWTTAGPSRGVVELYSGAPNSKPRTFQGEPPPSRDHRIKVTGLRAATKYRYRVLVFDPSGEKPVATSPVYVFRSAPPPQQKFQFAFLSDSRATVGGGFANFGGVNAEITQKLLADSVHRGADLILFVGDLVYGTSSKVENFDMMFNAYKEIVGPVGHIVPIYEGFGNHDSLQEYYIDAAGYRYHREKTGGVSAESLFASHFANPDQDFPAPEIRDGVVGPSYQGTVYSFDYGNSHFIMLNSLYWWAGGGPGGDQVLALKLLGGNREGYIMDNQIKWLAKDLAAARKRGVQHIFICSHDVAFPTGGHAADAMWWNGLNDPSIPSGDVVAMRNRFMKLLNDYGVTALLCGHEHEYSRTIIDSRVEKLMSHSLTQVVSGGSGAPLYRQDLKVPWVSAVKKYAMLNHYVLISVDGGKVALSAIDVDGRVFDTAILK
jgi:3',5'-cyclic AMP phosphodiesterase CpdA